MKYFLSFFALFLCCSPILAATSPEVLAYSLPADAVKRGPLPRRDANVHAYAFFAPSAPIKPENVLGYETFFGSVLVERELFKNGKKHGMQREWHHNGQPKSEAPYNLGQMDGTFKHWNDTGQLVGQYEMKMGNGQSVIYHNNGVLQKVEDLKSNERDGTFIEIFLNGQINYVGTFKKGHSIGLGLGFYVEGALYYVAWSGGPFIYFYANESVKSKKWRIRGEEISEADYAQAAAIDKSLPPYFADVTRYKGMVTPEVMALLQKYLEMPRVKIPLEFDATGQPISAIPLQPTKK